MKHCQTTSRLLCKLNFQKKNSQRI